MTMMTNLTNRKERSESRKTWAVSEAKAHFSELIDRAVANGPQTITRKGRITAVIVSVEEWQRKTSRKGNLAEFFAASPLRGSRLKIERTSDGLRKIRL